MVAVFIIVLPAEVGFCDGGLTRSPLVGSGVSVGVSVGGVRIVEPFFNQETTAKELRNQSCLM